MRTLKLLIEDLGLTVNEVINKGGLPESTTFQFVREIRAESFAKRTPGRYYFAISDALGGNLAPDAIFARLIELEAKIGQDWEDMIFTIDSVIEADGKDEAINYLPELIANYTQQDHYIKEYTRALTMYVMEVQT